VHCTKRSSYLLRVESRSDTMVLESATMWVCVSHSYKYNCGSCAFAGAHTTGSDSSCKWGSLQPERRVVYNKEQGA